MALRYDDGFDPPRGSVEARTQLDFRLTWEPNERWQCSFVGRNLLDSHTDEGRLKDTVGQATEVEREWYMEVRYAF